MRVSNLVENRGNSSWKLTRKTIYEQYMTCNGKGISIWNYCIFVDSFSGEYSLLSSSKPLLLILSNEKRIWHLWGELSVIPRMCSSYRYWLGCLWIDSIFLFLWTHFPLIFLSQHFLHIILFMNLYFSRHSMYFSIFDWPYVLFYHRSPHRGRCYSLINQSDSAPLINLNQTK